MEASVRQAFPRIHRTLHSIIPGNQQISKPAQWTKSAILNHAKKTGVAFVNMQFSDIDGMIKAVTIPIHKLEEAIDHNVWFDGSSIQGFTRIFESDMFLKPDLATYSLIPWSVHTEGAVTARIICDVFMPDGTPFQGDPRYLLKRMLARAEKMGYIYNVGPELEFFLFKKDENGRILIEPQDSAGYFDQNTDLGGEIRKDITLSLDQMGIEVEALHHEVAEGQHEINFRYAGALQTADNAITLRYVVKSIANLYNLHASFMPKPIAGINGSGMHVHQSFFKNGKNVFYDAKDPYRLSKLARSFLAGQLKHIRAMNAVINPTINSYKRLVVGYEAPAYIAWGNTNRSALIRIPRYTKGREQATRMELRCPDPACNPYLAFTVMLAAGLDGIENDLTPPDPVEENIFDFSDEEVKKRSIGTLCPNLRVALKELKADPVIRNALGEHTFEQFYSARKRDYNEYKTHVTQWEYDRYLKNC